MHQVLPEQAVKHVWFNKKRYLVFLNKIFSLKPEYFRCVSNGRFKDQFNCAAGKYFECAFVRDSQRVDQSGVLSQRECPIGLRFNPACDSCDYAANVMC